MVGTIKKMSYNEWLRERHGTSAPELYHMACVTERAGVYYKWMEFLRYKYYKEMDLLDAMTRENPFENQENGGNENG